jgi:hypothetical protein
MFPVTMPEPMIQSLKERAEARQTSVAAIIRQMIIDHINGSSKPKDQPSGS